MNNKTNLIEEYVNFVDTTTKQNTYYYKTFIGLFVIIVSLFSFYLLFTYLNYLHFFFRSNI